MSEQIGICESCCKPILPGDKYSYSIDGCFFCEQHSGKLSDCIAQHQSCIDDNDEPWIDFGYDSREEMAQSITDMKTEIETTGDRSLAAAD